ncbi:LysR family transcriptional regulator [Pseudomonas schmalbachii]|uniref:LysR family transcriptional regulator n=1 Tax=Pseudomonas schmalbachii TaxID=2816993 RepID=A0ABS3TUP1_9PSED|nr:LysR family transcriptional regulator [Pseudomonas schmalbachii]MBO3277391.1 LysR family transcriptional regulator [Pseudomonas schmalbachii]
MELRQLKQVLVLAETLNFRRAAEQLHIAQPPLSTSIKKLEEELGVLLFERLPSGLRLTPAGEVVLRNARRTLFYAEEIRRSAREGESGEQGRLRVGFVGSASYALLPRIVRSFRERYPRIDLLIEEGPTSGLLRRLDEHTLDVALVRFPVLESTSASITLLQRERLVLAVSSDSPLATRDEVEIAELAELPFIIYSRSLVPSLHALTLYAFQEAGIQPRIVQEAVQVHAILGLVEGGLGVALLPDGLGKYAGDGIRLIPLRGVSEKLVVGTALAVLPDAVTPAARNFIEHVREVVQVVEE